MENHLQDLKEIRSMMQKSTRFISLSGFSGVLAGIYALAGAGVAYWHLEFYTDIREVFAHIGLNKINQEFITFLTMDALAVLILAIGTSLLLTLRKVKKNGETIDTPAAKRLAQSLLVPLLSGGIFILFLLTGGLLSIIVPSMLLFYGIALVQASTHTLDDVKYLGYGQLLLGLISLADPARGLLYWALGFGVLHIVYGIYMYLKYERKGDA